MLFDAPINNLSLGNVSFNILKELYRRDLPITICPVGNNVDMSAFVVDQDFGKWIVSNCSDYMKRIKRDSPTFRNWHIAGAERKLSDRQFLYTYYEVDSPTEEEINTVQQQDWTFFSSSFAADKFKQAGCTNVSHVPVGFDSDFKIAPSKISDEIIHFGLIGKFERRKNTKTIIQNWLKKYGNNKKYLLTCLVNNQFFKPEDFQKIIATALDGKEWTNINFLPFLKKNSHVNEVLNSIDIDLSGFSNGEGWNLGAFNATALGKWSIVSNCSSHKDWATSDNSILVEPIGMQDCYDNYFFVKGNQYNQGKYFLLSDESLMEAFERAESKAKTINTEGIKLQEQFTYSKMVDSILTKLH